MGIGIVHREDLAADPVAVGRCIESPGRKPAAWGLARVERTRSRVVLPEPFLPKMQTISPDDARNETPENPCPPGY